MKGFIFFFFLLYSLIAFSQNQEIDESSPEFVQIVKDYNHAQELSAADNFDEAITVYKRLIESFKLNFGWRHENYIIFQSNLALLYEKNEQFDKAVMLHSEAIANTGMLLGKRHPNYILMLNNLAVLREFLEEYDLAISLYQEILNNIELTIGKEHNEYGYILNKLALQYDNIGEYQKALPLYLEGLKNIETSLGKEHPNYATLLNNLGTLYLNLKEIEKAVSFFEMALKSKELNLGKNHPSYRISLNNLADLYLNNKQYLKALTVYEELLNNIKLSLGAADPNYMTCVSNLAFLYRHLGDNQKALRTYEEALKDIELTLGIESPKYRTSLDHLSFLYRGFGEYQKAIRLDEKGLKITELKFGQNHAEYGKRLNKLALLYDNIGEHKQALPIFKESLGILENTLGKKDSEYGITLNNMAGSYQGIRNYSEALLLYQESLKIIRESLGENHSTFVTVLNNIATLYARIGNYDKAIPSYKAVLSSTEHLLGKNHSEYAMRLSNLAGVYSSKGDYNIALPIYEEALSILDEVLGIDHPKYGHVLNNLTSFYILSGKYGKALPIILEAKRNIENSLGKNHHEYFNSLNNLAEVYSYLGDYQKAEILLKEVLNGIKNTQGIVHPKYGEGLFNLAVLYESMEKFKDAIPLYLDSNRYVSDNINSAFSYQSENGKEAFVSNIVGNHLNTLSRFNYVTNNSYQETIPLAANNILTSKGLLLNANKDLLKQLESLEKENISTIVSSFRLKREFLNAQIQLAIIERASNFSQEKKELEILEHELIKEYKKHFDRDINHVNDWRKTNLEKEEIAIEFTYFDAFGGVRIDTSKVVYAAYIYKKEWNTPKVVNLFEEKELAKFLSVSDRPNDLYQSRGGEGSSTKSKVAISDSIYNLVWKPLEPHLKGNKTIYFSPDGILHKIPFAALPDENGNLIGELYNIQQMGNTADVRTNDSSPDLQDLLLIGGIQYDYKENQSKPKKEVVYSLMQSDKLLGDEKNRNITRNGFAFLPGTQTEIQDIQKKFSSSSTLSGYNATETAFKELSGKSPSILHIATHGFFFPKLEERKNNIEIMGKKKQLSLSEDPLLRSGLLFANANYAWQNGNNPYEKDDGILTALEISNLDLSGTDIVILSACETGLGDIEGSEGVYGLQRAFKMAGVKTIIMSLWEVPDEETAEFMNLFYTSWKELNDHKEAFKVSQRTMMNKYRDNPEKWAAFVMFE